MKPSAILIVSCAVAAMSLAVGGAALAQRKAKPAATPATATAPAKASPAAGGAAAKPSAGFGNSKEPIDITADKTDVFQPEHRVVYTGQVEALQGQQRLRSPQLTLFFAEREGSPQAATKPNSGAGGGFGQIQRMEAEGPVYLVTPTQQAKGDHGTYDAVPDTIILTGNVVLMQDKNVSQGDRLVIDQKTGHSVLTSNTNSRVRGVFYPQDKDPNAPAAPGAPAKPTAAARPAAK